MSAAHAYREPLLSNATIGRYRHHKDALLRYLPKKVKEHPLWPKYQQDAEDMDGLGYWTLFKSAAQLAHDFKLYATALTNRARRSS